MTDLEKAREKSIEEEPLLTFFATGQPTIGAYSQDNLRNQFEAGAEWKEQQMIDKAVKWLENNVWEYTGLDYSALTESFINAMKRE